MAAKFDVFADENRDKHSTKYWIKGHINHVLLLILVRLLLLSCLYFYYD